MAINVDSFSGIAPKVSPPLLQGNMGVTANNVRVDQGALHPIKGVTVAQNISNTARSIFKYLGSWYYWASVGVDAVRSPIANDAWNRVYYTGNGAPKYSYAPHATPILGGFNLGIPKPGNAPTLGVTVGVGTPKIRYYVFCYVSPLGEEGPPSPVSTSLSCVDGDTVTINFTSDSLGAYNLGTGSMRRVYRTALGTTTSVYERVGDYPIATLSVTESLLDVSLGEIIPSTTWFPPPNGLETAPLPVMKGLKISPNGFMVGYSGNALCPSEINLPHAYDPLNQLAFPGQITGLAITGDSIIVFTDDMPYLVTGSSPSSLTAIKIDHPQTCPSKASIVNMGGYVLFASPDGLCSITANDLQIVTQAYLTRDQWQAYSPATLRGFFYEGIYLGFSDASAFMFDMRENTAIFTTLDHATFDFISGYTDLATDILYLLKTDGSINSWETGAATSLTWKSKPLRLPKPICPAALRAYASGSFTLKLYADGNLVFTGTVTNNEVVRLPSGYRAKEFQVEVSGTSVIDSLSIANSVMELAQ
jgi:hypothetical protein